jgi:hypothetical protein
MMKKYLSLIILFSIYQSFSQEIYLSTGKNFTKYDYRNALGETNQNLKSGTGNYYEVVLNQSFKNKHFLYSLGLSLNDYNAVGGSAANYYSWDTKYLGVKGGISYSFFPKENTANHLDLLLNGGIMGESIIYGKQEIDGSYYDLVHQKEFSGLFIQPYIGFEVKYQVSSLWSMSLGYDFIQTLNLSGDNKEKLLFNTKQIRFGVHFPIQTTSKNSNTPEIFK